MGRKTSQRLFQSKTKFEFEIIRRTKIISWVQLHSDLSTIFPGWMTSLNKKVKSFRTKKWKDKNEMTETTSPSPLANATKKATATKLATPLSIIFWLEMIKQKLFKKLGRIQKMFQIKIVHLMFFQRHFIQIVYFLLWNSYRSSLLIN